MIPKEILSVHHPFVKEVVKIRQDKNFRYAKKQVFIGQERAIFEIAHRYPIDILFTQDPHVIQNIACRRHIIVSKEVMKKLTGVLTPQNFAALVAMPPLERDFFSHPRILVLDHLQDPGNVGTLMRTALALGWDGVIYTENSVDPFNEKALRASLGAALLIPLAKKSEEDIQKLALQHHKIIYLADLQGEPLSSLKLSSSFFLVLSSEAHGLQWNKGGVRITIPMAREGIESLNVASAGAIFMYEMGEKF